MKIDKEIIQAFLKRHQLATICATEGGRPFCFNCFYGFDPDKWLLVFKSSPGSRQVNLFDDGTTVAGTILGEKISLHFNAGIQFEGEVVKDAVIAAGLTERYYKQYPLSLLIDGEILMIRLQMAKLTQTQAGFRNRYSWRREETV